MSSALGFRVSIVIAFDGISVGCCFAIFLSPVNLLINDV
jgi:hypothetical protein